MRQCVCPFYHCAQTAEEQHDKSGLCHFAEKAEKLVDPLHERRIADDCLKQEQTHGNSKSLRNNGQRICQVILPVSADSLTSGKKCKRYRRKAHVNIDFQEPADHGQQQDYAGNDGCN